ncbi:hypothetical protein SAMN05421504_107239 [Amycolatopsis xylanica]|uniref:Uncharacterized protein n=2 Tax=Amycolatopsis xylanica TaxID=589385 RepID=A0A1H3NE98_9PSEU|nr:hypothetical protein SAMN05421504_107239 [Amycolatopsis xylanica]
MITMSRSGSHPIVRWTLLCALLLGVVAMHHVVAAHGPGHGVSQVMAAAPEALTEPVADEPGVPADGMLHLCLAILIAFAAAALTLLALRSRFRSGVRMAGPAYSRAFARAPPAAVSGRVILHLACVLRI